MNSGSLQSVATIVSRMTNGSKDALHEKRQMKRCALEAAVDRKNSTAGYLRFRQHIATAQSGCGEFHRRYFSVADYVID